MLTCTVDGGEALSLYTAQIESRNFMLEASATVCKSIIEQVKGKNVVEVVLHNDVEDVTRTLNVIFRSGQTSFMETATAGTLSFFLIEEK